MPLSIRSQAMRWLAGSAVILALVGAANAHSWVEEMQVISSNGSFIGDHGYMRGYMARTDPGYNGGSDDYILPPAISGRTRINGSDLLCHPSQRTSNYSSTYPRLTVNPGGYVAMKYLENGHVTNPSTIVGKPKAAGTVFVYGTTSPSDDEKIVDVLQWTEDGTGGDGRGSLLTAQNFDDGRCHQISDAALSVQRQQEFPDHMAGQPTSVFELWCETDLKIPTTAAVGKTMTIYWVWQWPTSPTSDLPTGKDEYYTSCAEVDVAAEEIKADTPVVHTISIQDPMSTAVPTFTARTAFTTSPPIVLASATGNGIYTLSPSAASAVSNSAASASTASSDKPSSATHSSATHSKPAHSSSASAGSATLPYITVTSTAMTRTTTTVMSMIATKIVTVTIHDLVTTTMSTDVDTTTTASASATAPIGVVEGSHGLLGESANVRARRHLNRHSAKFRKHY